MNRYWDLMRDILLAVKDNHHSREAKYDDKTIEEHLHDLVDMEWIRLHPELGVEGGRFVLNDEPVVTFTDPQVFRRDLFKAMSLRPTGKDFLDMVRHDDVWEWLKGEIDRFGGMPTETVIALAKKLYAWKVAQPDYRQVTQS